MIGHPALKHWYRFEGNAVDAVTGTALSESSALYESAKVGLGASFNGATNKRTIYRTSNGWSPGTNNYAICGWIKIDNVATNPQIIYTRQKSDGGDYLYIAVVGGSKLQFANNGSTGSGGNHTIDYDLTGKSGEWFYFAYQREALALSKAYINGVYVGQNNTGNHYVQTSGVEYFGRWATDIQHFSGMVDEFQLFDFGNSTSYFTIDDIKRNMALTSPLGRA